MQCPTPDLRDMGFEPNGKLLFDYGFIMDGVWKLLRLQKEDPGIEQIRYISYPNLYRFESPVPFDPKARLEIYVSKLGS